MLGLQRLLSNPRLRSETTWVVAHKAIELGVVGLVSLKLFTNLMDPKAYGEYQLGLASLLLVINLFEVPVTQVYLRQYHTAIAAGIARSALAQTMRWLGITTLIVTGGCALLTKPLADAFQLETLTVLAVGLIFLANRWRSLRIQVLDIQRERRRCMLENIGFFALQMALGALALVVFGRTATVALLAYAAAAAVFGGMGLRSFRRELRTLPDKAPAPFSRLVYTYGVPLGVLTTCQWLQMFADRYALGYQVDLETVGRYVAAYQVCGVPFMAMNAVLTTLVQPIAFQRARDITNPGQLWSADKLLLGSIGLYLAAGVIITAGYAVLGPWLLRVLANKAYAIPAGTLTMLAAARLLMFSGLLQHMIFKVHQQTRYLLLYSVIGGLIAVGTAFPLVKVYGVAGAALAVLITGLIYNVLLVIAPGGIWPLLRRVRTELPRTRNDTPVPAISMPEGGL